MQLTVGAIGSDTKLESWPPRWLPSANPIAEYGNAGAEPGPTPLLASFRLLARLSLLRLSAVATVRALSEWLSATMVSSRRSRDTSAFNS